MGKKLQLVFVSIFMTAVLHAQDSSSVVTGISVKNFNERDLRWGNASFASLDTSFLGFHTYSLLYKNGYHIGVGNLGLAAQPLFPIFDTNLGFRNGQNLLDKYETTNRDINYYQTKSPYTELNLVTAAQKEQVFSFIHSQNITPRLNAGIEYKRIGSEGYFPRQKANHLTFLGFVGYQSKNERYQIISNAIFNNLRAEANGGLINDSVLNASGSNLQFADVRLTEARNESKNTAINFRQLLNITKSENAGFLTRVSHSINYRKNKYSFKDNSANRSFFFNQFKDSLFTNDSTLHTIFSTLGELLIAKPLKNNAQLGLAGSISFQNHQFEQLSIDTTFTILGFSGRGFYKANNTNIEAEIRLNDRAEFNFRTTASTNFNKLGFAFTFQQSIAQPEFIFQRYDGNHQRWVNNFEDISTTAIDASIVIAPLQFSVKANYQLIKNYTYFTGVSQFNFVRPLQLNSELDILTITASKGFPFGKFLLTTSATYAKTDFTEILNTPKFYTENSFSYTNSLFKVLKFQVGVEGRYFSKTKAFSYSPEIGRFYVDESNREIGNYPILDLFLSASLKRVRFLLRFDHANQGFPKDGYQTVQRYPMPDRTFKFGVNWRFYD